MIRIFLGALLITLLVPSCKSKVVRGETANRKYRAIVLPRPPIDSVQSVIIDSFTSPLKFFPINMASGQTSFESVVSNTLKVQLFPRNGRRDTLRIHTLNGIIGVTHFFMDHDLTTGYVHEYTKNFFKVLRDTDFVLKFHRSGNSPVIGFMSYIRKGSMQKSDTLGKNIAFFRQWKLSEIDYRGQGDNIEINLKLCPPPFTGCAYPRVKPGTTNPYPQEIPIWVQSNLAGYLSLNKFEKLDQYNGGTAVIIWPENNSGQILFQDIHSSLSEIIRRAIEISQKYHTDPTIGVYDAGPMAHKFVANQLHELNADQFAPHLGWVVGAGFGYVPQVIYVLFDKKTNRISYRIQ
jgi:hypothetical protein